VDRNADELKNFVPLSGDSGSGYWFYSHPLGGILKIKNNNVICSFND
jgi:hypothetical protein